MTVSAGTSLILGPGAFAANASSSITGAGQFTVNGASGTLAGLAYVTGTNTFANGTVNLTGNYICTNNTLAISGGTANFDGTGTISPAIVTLSGGTLGGSNAVTVGGAMNWTGGAMSGSGRIVISPAAALNINSPPLQSLLLTTRTLENAGTSAWTGAGNLGLNNAVITNRPGALFDIQNASSVSFFGGAQRLDNAGTLRKSASTGTATIGIPFGNFGTVDIRNGTLAANSGYVSSSNALLACTLGGTTPGTNFGLLQVNGSVTLNGGLGVVLASGYAPNPNDSFAVVTSTARNGAFASLSYPSNQVTMELSNTPTSVLVRVTATAATPPLLFTPMLAGSNVLLTWSAVSNSTYRLEFNPTLAPSNWSGLPGDVLSTGSTASKLDALTPSNRFYRVRVLP
jgi:hypothetical protein